MHEGLSRVAVVGALSLAFSCGRESPPSPRPMPPPPHATATAAALASAATSAAPAAEAAAPRPGSVAWLAPLALHEPVGLTVRAGHDRIVVAQPYSMGGDVVVDGRLASPFTVFAFGLQGDAKWSLTLPGVERMELGAMQVAPDGATWVYASALPSSEPSFRPESVLSRIDASGKVTLTRRFSGLLHSHAIAFSPAGETAVAHVETDARGLKNPAATNLAPPRAVVMFLDAKGTALGDWRFRAEALDVAFDDAGRLHAQVQLDDAALEIAGQTVKGPGAAMVTLGRGRKPERIVRLRRFYAAPRPGASVVLFDVERGARDDSADIVRRDALEGEIWRTRVCATKCTAPPLAANASGETLYWASSPGPVDVPFAPTIATTLAHPAQGVRIVKLDERGALRFAVLGSCVRAADIAPDGRVAVVGADCMDVALADRSASPAASPGYVALLRR